MMNHFKRALMLVLCFSALSCSAPPAPSLEAEPFGRGQHAVGSTNMAIAPQYAEIGDDAMHDYLLGRAEGADRRRFLTDILEYPESAWLVDVPVPDNRALYGPAAGLTLPIAAFVTFPSADRSTKNRYTFPYHGGSYGIFEDMLEPGELPLFADPNERYPLILLSHGASAHGIYDVAHAQSLASHGYIVVVITYGDDRTAIADTPNRHLSFLRPFLTSAMLDSVLESETFGPHIDTDNIGITGHSFGGFTALAVAGGPYQGDPASVSDKRIKAGVIAAPWVGGNYDGADLLAFGPDNRGLSRVTIPIICFFGTNDRLTESSFILPAMRQLSGPTYVIELVDQPHIFEAGSWEDRNNWELLFFSAYLKNDAASLATLRHARSMRGGNEDVQLFDYQKSARARQ